MITLSIAKTSGKEAHRIVIKAIKQREKETGQEVSKQHFCDSAGLSRMMLKHYRDGVKPGPEGIAKISAGLKAWGLEVEVVA